MSRPLALVLLAAQIGVALFVATQWDDSNTFSRICFLLTLTAVFFSLPTLLVLCLFPHNLVVVIHGDAGIRRAAFRLVDFIFCGVAVLVLLGNAAFGSAGTITTYLFPFMVGWLAAVRIDLHRIMKRLQK